MINSIEISLNSLSPASAPHRAGGAIRMYASVQALASASIALAACSMLLAGVLFVAVRGLRGRLWRVMDHCGMLRRSCVLSAGTAAGPAADSLLLLLESGLEETEGMIRRNESSIAAMRSRLATLEQRGMLSPTEARNSRRCRRPHADAASPASSASSVEQMRDDERQWSYLVGYLSQKRIDRLRGSGIYSPRDAPGGAFSPRLPCSAREDSFSAFEYERTCAALSASTSPMSRHIAPLPECESLSDLSIEMDEASPSPAPAVMAVASRPDFTHRGLAARNYPGRVATTIFRDANTIIPSPSNAVVITADVCLVNGDLPPISKSCEPGSDIERVHEGRQKQAKRQGDLSRLDGPDCKTSPRCAYRDADLDHCTSKSWSSVRKTIRVLQNQIDDLRPNYHDAEHGSRDQRKEDDSSLLASGTPTNVASLRAIREAAEDAIRNLSHKENSKRLCENDGGNAKRDSMQGHEDVEVVRVQGSRVAIDWSDVIFQGASSTCWREETNSIEASQDAANAVFIEKHPSTAPHDEQWRNSLSPALIPAESSSREKSEVWRISDSVMEVPLQWMNPFSPSNWGESTMKHMNLNTNPDKHWFQPCGDGSSNDDCVPFEDDCDPFNDFEMEAEARAEFLELPETTGRAEEAGGFAGVKVPSHVPSARVLVPVSSHRPPSPIWKHEPASDYFLGACHHDNSWPAQNREMRSARSDPKQRPSFAAVSQQEAVTVKEDALFKCSNSGLAQTLATTDHDTRDKDNHIAISTTPFLLSPIKSCKSTDQQPPYPDSVLEAIFGSQEALNVTNSFTASAVFRDLDSYYQDTKKSLGL